MSRFLLGLQPHDDKDGFVGIYEGTGPGDIGSKVAAIRVAEVVTETRRDDGDDAATAHAMADARFLSASTKMFDALEAFVGSFSENGEFNSRTAEHSIVELRKMALLAMVAAEPCDCELPGQFCSGVPGIIAAVKNGRLAEGAYVERCEKCERFSSDDAASDCLKSMGIIEVRA